MAQAPSSETDEAPRPTARVVWKGAISFGLVAGKGNFYFPWGSKKGSPEPKVWHHDILRPDGTPYDAAETALIRRLTGPAR